MHQVIYPFHFFSAFRRVIFQVGWLVYLLVALQSVIDQWTTNQMQAQLGSPTGTSSVVYFYGLLSILNSLVFPSALIVVVVTTLNSSWEKIGENFNQVLIETLRAWGKALLWGFLFIIPGIIQWLRLSLVPFVVMLSPAYDRGEIDALEESERLSHGELLPLLILFFVMAGVLPMALTSFDEFKNILHTPGTGLLYNILETVFAVVFCLWLLKIYARHADGPHPSNIQSLTAGAPPEPVKE